MNYVGIDPGLTGGIAILNSENDDLIFEKYSIPFGDILRRLKLNPIEDIFALEKVSSSPQMGRASAFSFGYNAGTIAEAILDRGFECYHLLPQEWQSHFGKFSKDYGTKKEELYLLAKESFSVRFPKYISDAVLMAKFLKDRHGNKTLGNRKLIK